MKIIIIGSTGTIGAAVASALEKEHVVIGASRKGDVQVDLSNPDSIKEMYQSVQDIDAVISAAGEARFGSIDSLTDEDINLGLNSKLMGQINLVRYGRKHLNKGGVITLTTGILAHNPNPQVPMLTMINLGLEGFVQASAQDMPNHIRLNAVCPPMASETAEKMGWGAGGVPAAEIAKYYVHSVESKQNGALIGPTHSD
jgi:NAD(P)-dependent dehydrogenase (short-subunit alcohol dehydrogenase family)